MLCEAMNWAHLPVAGGLYDQHPQLLDEWTYIFQERHAHDEHDRIRKEREQAKPAGNRRARP